MRCCLSPVLGPEHILHAFLLGAMVIIWIAVDRDTDGYFVVGASKHLANLVDGRLPLPVYRLASRARCQSRQAEQ